MRKLNNGLVLRKNDYNIINSYLRGLQDQSAFDRQNVEDLQAELKKAKVVYDRKFPADVVGLNSTVTIAEDNEDKVMELTLVTPDKADIRSGKISIMAPIGIALIGFKRGQKVQWRVPSGKKTFTILDVKES